MVLTKVDFDEYTASIALNPSTMSKEHLTFEALNKA